MVTLRLATPEDEDRVLRWRNDPVTRRWSFSHDEVSPEEHHLWFTGRLDDPSCAFLIVEEGNRSVGQIRLERITPTMGEVSIGLSTDVHRRGLGREALGLVSRDAFQLLGVTSIRALVMGENIPSLRAFRAAGFREVGEDRGVVELQRTVD